MSEEGGRTEEEAKEYVLHPTLQLVVVYIQHKTLLFPTYINLTSAEKTAMRSIISPCRYFRLLNILKNCFLFKFNRLS